MDFCEICDDGEACTYCSLAGIVKCEGRWVPVECMLDPCVETDAPSVDLFPPLPDVPPPPA